MRSEDEQNIIGSFKSINIKKINKIIQEESMLSFENNDEHILYIPRKSLSLSEFEFLDSFIHFDDNSSEFIFKSPTSKDISSTKEIKEIKEIVKKQAMNHVNQEYRSQKEDVLELIAYRKAIKTKVKEYKEKVRREKYQKFLDEQYGTIQEIFAAIDSREKKEKPSNSQKTENIKKSSKGRSKPNIPNENIDFDLSQLDEKQTIKDFMKETKQKSEDVLKYLENGLRESNRIHYKA